MYEYIVRLVHTVFGHCEPESIEWIIEGQAFLRIVWFGSTNPPPPLSVSTTGDPREERLVSCWRKRRGEWRGWAWSRIIRPQESLALYKSFYTLCYTLIQTAFQRKKEWQNKEESCVNKRLKFAMVNELSLNVMFRCVQMKSAYYYRC